MTTEYFLNGSQIIAQKTGDDVMWFFYDASGTRIGMYYNGVTYYYLYNLQGDVVALARAYNGKIVAKYAYDAWGNCTVTNASGTTIGDLNPFRYRGYYYDTESGFYYLNSRYYSSEFGRFISADTAAVVAVSPDSASYDKNLYAYCDNNPVCRKDDGGEFWAMALLGRALIGAATVYVGDVIGNVLGGARGINAFKPSSSWGDYIGAAVSGMIPGKIVGSLVRPIVGTVVKHTVNGTLTSPESRADIVNDLLTGYAGEALCAGVDQLVQSARPQNYSSFRHQLTRRFPHISQQTTRALLQGTNKALNGLQQTLDFLIGSIM